MEESRFHFSVLQNFQARSGAQQIPGSPSPVKNDRDVRLTTNFHPMLRSRKGLYARSTSIPRTVFMTLTGTSPLLAYATG
jgi:hypothetical protein